MRVAKRKTPKYKTSTYLVKWIRPQLLGILLMKPKSKKKRIKITLRHIVLNVRGKFIKVIRDLLVGTIGNAMDVVILIQLDLDLIFTLVRKTEWLGVLRISI